MLKHWYVIQAYSDFERDAQKTLEEHIARENMGDCFGQILVPVEEVVDVKNGRKAASERKFYPGYVLVEMEITDDSWHLVKNTPRVNGFVGGSGNHPIPISQKNADAILQQAKAGVEKSKPKVGFEVDQQVRVDEGPFADFNDIVDEINYERDRLRVSVQIFDHETPVGLEFSQVEKI